jgi:hypothetical protein
MGELTGGLAAILDPPSPNHANQLPPVIQRMDSLSVVTLIETFGKLTPREQFKRANFTYYRSLLAEQNAYQAPYLFQWVKGHAGYAFNEQADALADWGTHPSEDTPAAIQLNAHYTREPPTRVQEAVLQSKPIYWFARAKLTVILATGQNMQLSRTYSPAPYDTEGEDPIVHTTVHAIFTDEAAQAYQLSSHRARTIPADLLAHINTKLQKQILHSGAISSPWTANSSRKSSYSIA